MSLLIFGQSITPRLDYTCQVIFKHWYDIDYALTDKREKFLDWKGPRLQYCKEALSAEIPWILSHDLLFQQDIIPQEPGHQLDAKGNHCLFPNQAGDWPLDILAQTFYLLSRYEEYLDFQSDQHQRFPATTSIAYRHGFLSTPIIDYWANVLILDLTKHYPQLQPSWPQYSFQPTYDIDMAWAYRHRSWRGWAAVIRDILRGNWSQLKARYQAFFDAANDPFFTFPYLDQLHKKYQLQPRFFFLLADPGPFDKNPNVQTPALQKLIKEIASKYEIGIHPSYASNKDRKLLAKEVSRLQKHSQTPILHSRQHYLKLAFPATYQSLLKVGISHDYSLGFADMAGFRASTSRSFPWYNLSREEITDLELHPFSLMEVTLKNYQKLSASEAIDLIEEIIDQVKEVGGVFCPLWHNSSFSSFHGWEAWQEVYEALIKKAVEVSK